MKIGNGKRLKNIDMAFRGAVKRAGIEDVMFKIFRHTLAGHLVINGRPLKEVQELMGHENVQIAMKYAHLGLSK